MDIREMFKRPKPPPAPKKPHGIIDLGTRGLGLSGIDGVRNRLSWTDIQPKDSKTYDWSVFDKTIDDWGTGKVKGFSVVMLADAPPWLKAKRWTMPPTQSDHSFTIVLPWDPQVQPALIDFIHAFGSRYDGRADYIAMGGLGCVIESYLTPDPATIGLSLSDGLAKWKGSCAKIIEAHASVQKTTPFIFTAAKPFQHGDAVLALDAAVADGATKYGRLFGVMDCSLGAKSNTGYAPHALVKKYSSEHPVGLQMVTSSGGFAGHDLGGTLEEALQAGVDLLAQYIECYPLDTQDQTNAPLFIKYGDKLKAIYP